jgi:hypothetical protein
MPLQRRRRLERGSEAENDRGRACLNPTVSRISLCDGANTQELHVARREPPAAAHRRALLGKRNRTTTRYVMAESWSESGTISRTNPVSQAWLRDRRITRTGAALRAHGLGFKWLAAAVLGAPV